MVGISPETYRLAGLARNTTDPLKSPGLPHLPAGILARMPAARSFVLVHIGCNISEKLDIELLGVTGLKVSLQLISDSSLYRRKAYKGRIRFQVTVKPFPIGFGLFV
jgi:hypothetical protein